MFEKTKFNEQKRYQTKNIKGNTKLYVNVSLRVNNNNEFFIVFISLGSKAYFELIFIS